MKVTKWLVLAMLLLVPTAAQAQDVLQKLKNLRRDVVQKHRTHWAKPKVPADNAIECLAAEIDWLENYLDEYGSIVAKQPDIWGESRLTKFRQQVEEELAKQIDQFKLLDNAKIARTDIAQLAATVTVGAVANSSFQNFDRSLQAYREGNQLAFQQYQLELEEYRQRRATYEAAQAAQGLLVEPVAPTPPTIGSAPVAPTVPGALALSDPAVQPNTLSATAISGLTAESSLEPVIGLNQLKRYLDHLNQLRRINEGDDTSDAPGYALNLVRIPVSVMPGRATRRGYGAEVTITAKAYQSRALLPNTFRDLVVNDLVDQLSLPVLRLAEQADDFALTIFIRSTQRVSDQFEREVLTFPSEEASKSETNIRHAFNGAIERVAHAKGVQTTDFLPKLGSVLEYMENLRLALVAAEEEAPAKALVSISAFMKDLYKEQVESSVLQPEWDYLIEYLVLTEAERKLLEESKKEMIAAAGSPQQFEFDRENSRRSGQYKQYQVDALRERLRIDLNSVQGVGDKFRDSVRKVSGSLFSGATTTNRNQQSRFPLSPVIAPLVYGETQLLKFATQLKAGYQGRHIVWNEDKAYQDQIHIVDAQNLLKECFDAAYSTLAHPANRSIMIQAIEGSGPDKRLADVISLAMTQGMTTPRGPSAIFQRREWFLSQMAANQVDARVADYCWCLVVEMALLNQRLNEDVHEHAMKKGDCGCKAGCYHQFYLPMPECSLDAMEATDPDFCAAADAFCDYVSCRWPIHVFTIDPVNQEQNVNEASVVQRELSIIAALAFTSGRINMNQLLRFQRQFQEDIATVGLNRTQVGFMHGHDTFGWRFTPRVQTRKTTSNLRAFGESLVGRGPDANLKDSVLEPGARECTAIVLMPSFVPYCDFDIRTNWFQMKYPTHTDVSMQQTMKLSRSVTAMRNAREMCVQCSHLYRPGEIKRLINRVDQLEKEIPLQSMRAQIPYENTLGGFDLFNNGLTDLGPKLEGWYGAPGIVIGFNESEEDKKKTRAKRPEKTTLFLVADNLSVNQTQIIAGGIDITDKMLISRQVAKITVPDTAQLVEIGGRKFVSVYIATPYGVTNQLHIPVVTQGLEAVSAKTIADLKKELTEKIDKTPFSWSTTSTIDVEISFPDGKPGCEIGGIGLVQDQSPFKLKSEVFKSGLVTADQRQFSLVCAIKSEDGKTPIGQPVEMVRNRQFGASREVSFVSGELIPENVLREIQAGVKKKMFEGKSALKLKLETYILFKKSTINQGTLPVSYVDTFEDPVQIGKEIEVVVTAQEGCDTTVIPEGMIQTPMGAMEIRSLNGN